MKYIAKKLRSLKKRLFLKKDINVKKVYPIFVPRGKGTSNQLKSITNLSINTIFPSINTLSEHFLDKKLIIKNIEDIKLSNEEKDTAKKLEEMFIHFGSDKSTKHNYHLLYGKLLAKPKEISKILEIGLGTNNIDVLGNMGIDAKPGASIKAFKKICQNASIYGADIDERILFNEKRINTAKVDQLSQDSLRNLGKKFGDNFDLIIDDGLHAVLANVNTISVLLSQLKKGGSIAVEDIHHETLCIWELIYKLIPNQKFDSRMYVDKSNSYIFTIKKL